MRSSNDPIKGVGTVVFGAKAAAELSEKRLADRACFCCGVGSGNADDLPDGWKYFTNRAGQTMGYICDVCGERV